jgi:hypothetical protein
MDGVLTPWDTGMRFETDDVDARHRASPYRWSGGRTSWGTFWEHRRDDVQQIPDGQHWAP